ncbi:MAG: ATP-dependent metallopeptidase FtsH/Yme1/Tma family protein, partial [Candidatus Sericytochromatia bacterium]
FVLVYAKVMGGAFSRGAKFAPSKDVGNVRFSDVLGVNEAKLEAQEIVDFLKNAKEYQRIGAKVPRGVLLVGPPGTGKTLLAKAIANEAGVPFYALSGADFVEVFVGVGASRIRKLYQKARKHPAAIVFIDEIDALGRARSSGMFGSQESNQTLNQFLVELDGFTKGGTVITIGATNLEESLDAALLRPGRFDRKLHVGLPDLRGREELLTHYSRKIQVDPTLDVKALARVAVNMSGADLANMVNEASIMAVRAGRAQATQEDFSRALERLGLGLEHSRTISPREREIVAYHEAGHALLDLYLQPHKRLHKVSIIPTGRSALGYTWAVNVEDRYLVGCDEYRSEIVALLGGRAAEALVFGEVTSGAHSDLKRATKLAELMVWELGMTSLGAPANYKEISLAEGTHRRLDLEIEELMAASYQQAQSLLTEKRHELERLAKALLTYEVLYEHDIKRVLMGLEPQGASAPGDDPGPRQEWIA